MLVEQVVQRIERTIDAVLSRISGSLIIWTPLLFAAVFATAAASAFANERLGPELGNLAVAGGFFLIFLICFFVLRERSEFVEKEPPPDAIPESNSFAALLDPSILSAAERDVLNYVKSIAPSAVKGLLQQAPKNLHLLAGATIGLIVASRVAKMIERRADRS
jgi:hypothetical protein